MTQQEKDAIQIVKQSITEEQMRELLREILCKVSMPQFTGENVPVDVAAKVMKKEPQFIRAGLEQGWLNFGYAYKAAGNVRTSYYISPKLFWEVTGYNYSEQKTA